MISAGIQRGGEPNGHLIDRNWLPVPDGLHAGLILLQDPGPTRAATHLWSRVAFRLSRNDRGRLLNDLQRLDFSQRYDMWEWERAPCRCLVRFSRFERSVVVQTEGMKLREAPIPAWLQNCKFELLDAQQ